jgi:hypothetical protein
MLSEKLREILRDWWRVEKPGHWHFPGDIEGRHISKDAVELACQKARSRFPVRKPVTLAVCSHCGKANVLPRTNFVAYLPWTAIRNQESGNQRMRGNSTTAGYNCGQRVSGF